MNWKNVTIKKFIALNQAMKGTFENEESKTFAILSILFDKPSEYFENIPVNQLTKLIQDASFIYSKEITKGVPLAVSVNGVNYRVNLQLDAITSGQYIDLVTYCKSESEINNNYHNIISLFLSPVSFWGFDKFKSMIEKAKTKDELVITYSKISEQRRAIANELLNHLTMDDVFSLSNYFFLLLQNLTKGMTDYLMKQQRNQLKEVSNHLTKVIKRDMRSTGDGL
jgi:hypothetical protein